MRKIIIVEFITLDGVIQAPGGPEEDTSGDFKLGGWLVPFSDESLNEALGLSYGQPYDLLLGRKTYDIFAGYWPRMAERNDIDAGEKKFANDFNACTKYVATHSPDSLKWKNTEWLGNNLVEKLKSLKNSGDKNLLVIGSGHLAHELFMNDLVDEMHLFTAPVILGHGKRLFDAKSTPLTFKLTRSAISKTGMILTQYRRVGSVNTGSFAPKD
jgi:dihydrofolate reductase